MTDVFMSATELAAEIRQGRASPSEILDAFLKRIADRNPTLNAFVTLIEDQAREAARRATDAVKSGRALGPLHGVPIAIKDLYDFKAGVRSTFGSKAFADFVPNFTKTCIARLEAAGAIVVGKTNTSEFGHKATTDNFLFGPTSTPFVSGKNAGGSSGGSAAAVAAGLVSLAQGSDAGGSVRIPAAFCGVFGYVPTFGRIASVSFPNAFGNHTPFIEDGVLARTVEDAALMASAMIGSDPRDPFSLPHQNIDLVAASRGSIEGMRIAYSPCFDVFPVSPVVAEVVRQAVGAFEAAGADVEEVPLGIKLSQEELCEVWVKEIAVLNGQGVESFRRNGVDLLGEWRSELAPEYVAVAESARDLSAIDFKLNDVIRTEVLNALESAFDRFDLIVTPTLGVESVDNASDRTTLGPSEVEGQKVNPCIGWCLTYPTNLTGHPSVSIPAGFTAEGMPVGLQIIGRRWEDESLIRASSAFERVRPWYKAYRRLD